MINDFNLIKYREEISQCNDESILIVSYHNLGYSYKNGIHCEKNLPVALMYYSKAGKLGNDDSINNLRLCIEYIRDTEKEIGYPTLSNAIELVDDEILILLDCILLSTNQETMKIILQNNKLILKKYEKLILEHDYCVFKYLKSNLLARDYNKFIINANI